MNTIETYIKSLVTGNKSPATIRKYSGNLAKFQSYFNLQTPDDILKLTVEDYLNFYNAQNFKKESSLNDLIRSLKAFFSWMEISDIIPMGTAFRKVRFGGKTFVKEPKVEKEVLTEEETIQLIKAGRTIQERTMLCMMALQGFRSGTIRSMKLEDIKNCSVTISLKGNKKKVVSLHSTVCHMLNIFMANRDSDSPYLFYNERGESSKTGELTGATINNRTKSAARLAGFTDEQIKKVHAHGFRHYFGTQMIEQFGIEVAKEALNHASSNTTKIYDHSGSKIQNNAILNQRGLHIQD